MAVPIRTMVAPSSMATSKSWLMPLERGAMRRPGVRADILGFFQEWRDGHQAQDLEPRQGRGLPKERHQVRLGEPRFRQLAALVHLDEARYSLAQGPGGLVQPLGPAQ